MKAMYRLPSIATCQLPRRQPRKAKMPRKTVHGIAPKKSRSGSRKIDQQAIAEKAQRVVEEAGRLDRSVDQDVGYVNAFRSKFGIQ